MTFLELRARRGKLIKAAASINRVSGRSYWIIYCTGLITMNCTWNYSLSNLSSAQDSSPVIVYFHQIMHFNISDLSVLRIYSNDPVVVPIDKYTVFFNVIKDSILSISLGVKTKARVRSNHLQGKTFCPFRLRAFPRSFIFENCGACSARYHHHLMINV